ncbi:MAG: WD40/YVTN/BNR-like repeat-containing protein [Chthoniobacterales bacterium]
MSNYPRHAFITAATLIGLALCLPLRAQEEEVRPSQPSDSPAAAAASPTAAATTPPLSSAVTPSPAPSGPPQLTDVLFKSLKARSIGPAVMGGRVSDIAIDPRNPFIFYVGLAHGGVFKTGDNGVSFDPIFDKQPALSIGAIAVAPSDSDVLWVGSGEANDRNSSGWGNGVYRSTDGGENWQNVGLKDSRAIGRIVVHPKNPDTAYVAASGHLWVDGGDRGLFKTTDGGKTWKLVLQAPAPQNARTGCCDVALDPSNPEIVYAALYARRRTPWSFTAGPDATDGQDVGGIFKSTNGGATWKKLAGGLPAQTGRIGLAVSASNPKIVMAIVQSFEGGSGQLTDLRSKSGGVFRSEDSGEKWTRMSAIDPRPFYFSQIRIDPANDQRIYVLEFAVLVSDDAGRNFREDLSEKLHPDCHAFAIQPGSAPPPKPPKPEDKNKPPKPPVSQRLLLGTDGGVYQSFAGGKNWDHLNKIPAGEYYRISLDDTKPYFRIAGGLQDNENWVGPSGVQSKEGIQNSDWTALAGGDGFYVLFDPTDHDTFYAESQEGEIHRINLRNGELRRLRPQPAEGQPRYRFHWNSPMVMSKHNPGVIYLGGNCVFKLTDRAEKSSVISPDLTHNDPAKTVAVGSGAENYGVVFSLAESPKRAGLLWAGTDDGRLWLTENDGGKWTELTANLPEPARGQWIVRIEPGGQDPNVAYVVTNAYRTGDDRPMVLRTADLGKTWQSIVGDLPANTPLEVVREDPVNPKLLYAGAHFGIFASFDLGTHWVRIGDVPAVRVDDLQIHPRTSDLVIATHGRSIAILDDVVPLRELTPEIVNKPAHLFTVRPVTGAYLQPGYAENHGKGVYRGQNPPEGAIFTVWVKEFTGDEIKISVSKASGQPVANLKAPGAPGLARLTWDLRPTKDVIAEYGGDDPKRLLPAGDYNAELSFGSTKVKQAFHVDLAEGITPR